MEAENSKHGKGSDSGTNTKKNKKNRNKNKENNQLSQKDGSAVEMQSMSGNHGDSGSRVSSNNPGTPDGGASTHGAQQDGNARSVVDPNTGAPDGGESAQAAKEDKAGSDAESPINTDESKDDNIVDKEKHSVSTPSSHSDSCPPTSTESTSTLDLPEGAQGDENEDTADPSDDSDLDAKQSTELNMESLKRDLAKRDEEIKKLEEANERQKGELKKSNQNYEDLVMKSEEKTRQLNEEIRRCEDFVTKLEANTEDLKEEKRSDLDAKQSTELNMESLKRDLAERDEKIKQLEEANESQKGELEKSKQKYEDSVKKLEEQKEEIRRKVKEKESDIESYLLVIDKKNEEIKWAVDSEQSMEQELKTLQRDFEEKERELKSMQTNNTALDEKMKHIEVQNRTRSEYIENTAKKHMALADENSKLKSQISNLQGTIDDLNKVEKRLHKDIEHQCISISYQRNELEKLNSELKQEKEKYDKATKRYEKNIKAEKDKLTQERAEHEKTKKKNEDVIKAEKENANKEKEKLQTHLTRQWQIERAGLNSRIRELNSNLTQWNRAYENATFEISRLESQLHQQRKNNSELEAEKEELLLRLSKIAGAKLTYNNPNIADLSDEKRPTKLAEEFSELYDNEWTDAFEMVDGNDDEQKTGVLYDILKHANGYCGSLSRGHDESIERSFTTLEYVRRLPDRDSTDADIPKTNKSDHELNETTDVEKDQHDILASQDAPLKMDAATQTPVPDSTEDDGFEHIEHPSLPSDIGVSVSNIAEYRYEKEPLDETGGEKSEFTTDEGGECSETLNPERKNNLKHSGTDEGVKSITANSKGGESEHPEVVVDEATDHTYEDKRENSGTESDSQEVNHIQNIVNKSNDENYTSERNVDEVHYEKADGKCIEQEGSEAGADGISEDNHNGQPTIQDNKPHMEQHMPSKINDTEKENENADIKKTSEMDRDGENSNVSEGTNNKSENTVIEKDNQSSVIPDRSRGEQDGKSIIGKDVASKTDGTNSENKDDEQTDSNQQSDDHISKPEDKDKDIKDDNIDSNEQSDNKTTKPEDTDKDIKDDNTDSNEQSDNKTTKPEDTDKDKKDDNVDVSETTKHELVSKVDFKMDMFTTEQKKTIMDMKKTCEDMQTLDVIETGTKIIADEMNIKPELNEVMKYISKCIEVCWSMYRHVPPVHINFPTDLAGTCLDKNVYRPYTKSGKNIKFVVWPAVYLHEGGALLGKGVAQGRD